MVLRIRDFRLLWIGQTISQLGSQFNYVALAWMVLQATGSSVAMGGVFLAQVMPGALFGWVAGLVVDRVNRRRLMIACSVVRGMLVLTLPVSFAFGYMPMALVYGVTFVVATMTLLFYASEKTVIPEMVSEAMLTEANAYAEMTSQIANLAGPVLAGMLVAVLPSPVYALYLDVFGFAVSAAALFLMGWRDAGHAPEVGTGVVGQALEGVGFLFHDRFLRVVCVASVAANFLIGPFAVVFPIFSDKVLHTGSVGFGWLMGGIGGGMMLGSLAAARLATRLGEVAIICGGMTVVGGAFVVIGVAPDLTISTLAAAAAGFFIAPANAIILTQVQRGTPPHLQGRVFSTLFAVSSVALPGGVALAAPLVDHLGCRQVLMGMGAFTAGVALTTYVFLRRLEPPAHSIEVAAAP